MTLFLQLIFACRLERGEEKFDDPLEDVSRALVPLPVVSPILVRQVDDC